MLSSLGVEDGRDIFFSEERAQINIIRVAQLGTIRNIIYIERALSVQQFKSSYAESIL